MSEALDHVEAAISEVTAARNAVARGTSKQVTSADERDRLKSVAFAWFKSHKQHVRDVDTSDVDSAFQKILDSTDRHAARSTYALALKDAKARLVDARRRLMAAQPVPSKAAPAAKGSLPPESPPNFASLVADSAMQAILERRWAEVQQCIDADANLAATVMMGGLLESLLLARMNSTSNKGALFTAKACPRDKSGKALPLSEWKLVAMVEVAHEVGWITKSARDVGNVLRDFRNYIHPHKEHTDGVALNGEDSRMFWEVSKSICRQVLASIGSTP